MWNENQIGVFERWNNRLALIWKWLAALLLLRILWGIVTIYPSYFPADFSTPFLVGREGHFRGLYRIIFYIHIVSSPIALFGGLFLISDVSRRWLPQIHKVVGRFQIAIVCLAVVPSGLVMSFYALGGAISTMAFLFLSVLTGVSALFGFQNALRRRFDRHQRWMWRCWVLLSSAIVLRLLTMVLSPIGLDPVVAYRFSAWMSWLMPLMILELANWLTTQSTQSNLGSRGARGPRSMPK